MLSNSNVFLLTQHKFIFEWFGQVGFYPLFMCCHRLAEKIVIWAIIFLTNKNSRIQEYVKPDLSAYAEHHGLCPWGSIFEGPGRRGMAINGKKRPRLKAVVAFLLSVDTDS